MLHAHDYRNTCSRPRAAKLAGNFSGPRHARPHEGTEHCASAMKTTPAWDTRFCCERRGAVDGATGDTGNREALPATNTVAARARI